MKKFVISNQSPKELKINEQDGLIFLDEERIVLTSSEVFGTLRKDLAKNIGKDRVKGFLIRYGWNLGVNDARRAMKKSFASVEEVLRQGAVFHALKGYTKAKTLQLTIHFNKDHTVESVNVEGIWFNSYEAEENLRLFGVEEHSVCYTLIGYASGFYSTICGHKVIFKEISCEGSGDKECRYIGKSLHLWNGEADHELPYFEDHTIVQELETTYEMLLEERNNLKKTSMIHERLTEEIMKGRDLRSIANTVYKATGIPIIIEDFALQEWFSAGLTNDEFKNVHSEFIHYLNDCSDSVEELIKKTTHMKLEHHQRIITPIRLENRILGYCAFLFEKDLTSLENINFMVLEKVATVCSLYMLNEKSKFEAFERAKGHFLEQLLSGQLSAKQEILKRGIYLNMDLNLPFYILVLKHESELLIHGDIVDSLYAFFKRQKINNLLGQYEGYLVVLVQDDFPKVYKDISTFADRIVHYLIDKFPKSRFQIGVSGKGKHIQHAYQHYHEAMIALKISGYHKKAFLFEELEMTGILLNTQNKEAIKQKAFGLLGPLIEDKGEKMKELLKTLYVFLQNGGNLEKTLKDMAISMSGLRYRIEKIESLLGKKLRNPEHSLELLLAIKVMMIAGEIVIE